MVARRKCSRLQKFRFQLPQAATKRRIDDHITAADYHAADQGIVDRHLKVDLPPQTLCHRLCQRVALRGVELVRANDRDIRAAFGLSTLTFIARLDVKRQCEPTCLDQQPREVRLSLAQPSFAHVEQ